MTLLRLYLGLVAFSLLGSAFSQMTGLNPGPIAPIASAATLFVGLGAAFSPWIAHGRSCAVLLPTLLLGASSEISGVISGYPFGRYAYTDRWWPTVPLTSESRFPVLVPFAWLLVAGSAWLAAPGKGVGKILLGASIATFVDFLMEPVMAGPLDYWRWQEHGPLPGGAPMLNSVGWFVVSCFAGAILTRAGFQENAEKNARIVLLAHTLMVLGLGLILRG